MTLTSVISLIMILTVNSVIAVRVIGPNVGPRIGPPTIGFFWWAESS